MNGNQYGDSKDRKLVILKRLLDKEHLSYQKLADEYWVSRSSIANDISYIKKIFAKEGVSLTFDNSGTYFKGNEVQTQRILKRITLNNINNLKRIKILIDIDLLLKINGVLRKEMESKNIEIPESYMQSIVVSTLLIVQRGKNGHKINFEGHNQLGKLFLEFNKYPMVYELLKRLEDLDIYVFSSKEVQYLTYLIVGSGLKFFLKNDTIPDSFREEIRNLIQRVSEGIQVDLTQDSRLEEDAIIHLYQLNLRVEAHTTIVNPLLNEIKQNYPALYGIVWFALNDFCKPYQIDISEDEVGFIAIHFQAAIERKKELSKIIFVCPNGIGTSSFVSAKIRRILPEIDSIETTSIAKLKHLDLSDVDFIISTVDIKESRKPVVRISPMVTTRDMKRIMNYYIDLIIDNEKYQFEKQDLPEKIKLLLSKNIFFGDFQSKKEALNFLIENKYFSSTNTKNKFINSIYEREEIQSTYLDNGFAIPHGNPKLVEETNISILVLDKPILWGNQKVDIIILLMIREEEVKEIEPVMKLVMQGIEDKSWFISKMLEVKK
ncbi:BglG family transcription antiterminator [Carnobacterium sp. 17-4]|uniref:BglG family transcription antiterminator n=1 Tax=Carnobacterium sp. (strain 17-4) TaxID=208596 RepID=UPI0002D685B6|nr:PTS sugar transporter subunit IIA [Carnobacterium sp. 17-4]